LVRRRLRAATVVTLAAVLVPDLRPLSVGEIIDVAIKIWRRHLPTLAKIVFVVVAPIQILAALVTASVSSFDPGFDTYDAAGNPTIDGGALAAWGAGMLVAQLLAMLAFLIASAAVLRAVSVAYLGGTPQWKESLRAIAGRLGSLLWIGFLTIAGLIGSAIALIVPAIWLSVSWTVAYPALIAEGLKGTDALRRSFRLVRGRWWQTAGALMLAFMFQFFVGLVLGIPLAFLTSAWDSTSFGALAVSTVVTVVSSVITTPFMAAVLVLIYFDLRVRKEGFDLELLSQGVGVPGATYTPAAPWAAGTGWGSQGHWGAPAGQWGAPAGQWGGGPADPAAGQWGRTEQWGGGPAGWAPPGSGRPGAAPGTSSPPAEPEAPPATSWEEPIDPTGGWGPPPAPPQTAPPQPAPPQTAPEHDEEPPDGGQTAR
jgi:hypothetical protein